jgi:hypothetical protein
MDLSKGTSGDALRAMIVLALSTSSSVGILRACGSCSQPSSTRSVSQVANLPSGFDMAPRPLRGACSMVFLVELTGSLGAGQGETN